MATKRKRTEEKGSAKRQGIFGTLLRPLTLLVGPLTWENGRGWLKLILLVLVVRWAWFEPFKIPSGSMEPTLHGDPHYFHGDRVFVNKYHYGLRVPFRNARLYQGADVKRWEIVVFKSMEEEPGKGLFHRLWRTLLPKHLIKRVVGLPGERIHIADGRIHVNGEPVDPPEELRDILHYTSETLPRDQDVRRHLVYCAAERVGLSHLSPHNEAVQRLYTELERIHEEHHLADVDVMTLSDEQIKNMLDDLPDDLYEIAWNAVKISLNQNSQMRYGVLEDDEYSVVPKNCYLVLGDNSGSSRDGRVFGWLSNDHIVGRAYCIWAPPSRWRDFTGFTDTWWGLIALYGPFVLLFLYEIGWRFVGFTWRLRRDIAWEPEGQPGARVRRGERLWVSRLALGLRIPFSRSRFTQGQPVRRFDVVVCQTTSGEDSGYGLMLAGRIVGMPRDTVHIEDGSLRIDGTSVVADIPGKDQDRPRWLGQKRSTIPPGHYLVLEGTEADSADSRAVGWIAQENLIGRAVQVWWPLGRWRRLGKSEDAATET